MDFSTTDIQDMLAETVGEFTKKTSPIERARKLREDDTGWEASVWKQMGDLGWIGAGFSEEVGGLGGGFVDAALVLENLARTLVPEPYLPSVVAGMAIAHGGSSDQQETLLAPMIAGETSLALALYERDSRYDAGAIATTADKSGDGVTLSGQKAWVLNGHAADQIVVAAKTDNGLTLVVVDSDADGVGVEPVNTIDSRRAAMLTFDGVTVGADRVLDEVGGADALVAKLADYGAAAAAAESVGVAQKMLDMTVEYLKTREQFGVKIGAFQALQHRAVDMFVEVQLLQSAALASTVRADEDDADERAKAVSAAMHQLQTGGQFVSRQAIQLFGGIGVTDEENIGLYFKRMHALSVAFGDRDYHTRRYAALMDG